MRASYAEVDGKGRVKMPADIRSSYSEPRSYGKPRSLCFVADELGNGSDSPHLLYLIKPDEFRAWYKSLPPIEGRRVMSMTKLCEIDAQFRMNPGKELREYAGISGISGRIIFLEGFLEGCAKDKQLELWSAEEYQKAVSLGLRPEITAPPEQKPLSTAQAVPAVQPTAPAAQPATLHTPSG